MLCGCILLAKITLCLFSLFFTITLKTLHWTPQAVSTSLLVSFPIKQYSCQTDHWGADQAYEEVNFCGQMTFLERV